MADVAPSNSAGQSENNKSGELQVVLQRDAVTEPGLVQRVKGEGMPRQNNESSRGDLVVTYSISFPTNLSSDQKDRVRKLFG